MSATDKAALRRVVGDRQAVNAAADDEHVERARGEAIDASRDPCRCHRYRRRLRHVPVERASYSFVAWRPSTSPRLLGTAHSRSRDHAHPVGSRGFFDDLDQYHFEKLHHLLRLVDFDGYRGRAVLEVGCGAGVDLARFAKGGAEVTGVDSRRRRSIWRAPISSSRACADDFDVADGEQLPFADDTFDLVYAHGVVQYTANPQRLVDECRRVLKPGGEADLPGLQPRSRG